MYKHKKIAITGGPCAGKTTAMQRIVDEFTERGYKVFVVSETATDLINGGIRPFGTGSCDIVEFQRYVLYMQLSKEKLFEKVANQCKQDTIILCDRGIMDNRAYINDNIFRKLLKERNLNEMEVMTSYDLVIHLVTAADGAGEHYTTINNKARTETAEEAIVADKKTLDSWTGHDKLVIVDNKVGFDEKIDNVIKAIYQELGDPYPIQKQHKFLVDKINLNGLKNMHLVKLELEQFFVDATSTQNTMARKTTKNGEIIYTSTIKRDTDVSDERITISKKITEKDYGQLLEEIADKPIRKCRYCFTYGKQYYRLDIFENPKNLAMLEINLTNEGKEVVIPDFIDVKKDVTEDFEYRNANIFRKINGRRKNGILVKKKADAD